MTACRIDHRARQIAAIGQAQTIGLGAVILEYHCVIHAELVFAELQACFVHIHHRDLGLGHFQKLDRRHANRPGANHQHLVAGQRVRAVYAIAADRERLHQRELLHGQLGRRMQLVGWQQEPFAHAAVLVHADHLEAFAAISPALAAGVAFAAIHVRLNRAAVAGLNIFNTLTHRHHLHTQFVTGNNGVRKERHLTEVTGNIRAANAHAMHLHQRLARAGLRRFIDVRVRKVLGLFENDGFHVSFEISCSPVGPQCGRCP